MISLIKARNWYALLTCWEISAKVRKEYLFNTTAYSSKTNKEQGNSSYSFGIYAGDNHMQRASGPLQRTGSGGPYPWGGSVPIVACAAP
ncbi:hypothetical protein D9M70_616420 [compost metagenome]